MFIGLSIIIAGFMIAYSIYWLRRVISSIWEEAEGITHLFFAIQRTQLRLELFEAELEIPDWLAEMDEERDADWGDTDDTEGEPKTGKNQGAVIIPLKPKQEDV